MAAESEMVHTGLPNTGNRRSDRDKGSVYIGRSYEGGLGDSTESGRGLAGSSAEGQPPQPGIGHNVYDVVSATRHPLRYGEYPEGMVYQVGDINSKAKGSGARANGGKVRLDLIPLHLLNSGADVLEYGIGKYAEWNWAKGMQWNIPYQCLLRHLSAWYRGEDIDAESGKSHLGHAMANLLMLEHYATAYREGDNRPKEHFLGDEGSSQKETTTK